VAEPGTPHPLDAALDALRELTGSPLTGDARAQRLRTEVLLPIARHYDVPLRGGPTGFSDASANVPRDARATLAAGRACLVILGNGRTVFGQDVLREVLRLGEALCELHVRALGTLAESPAVTRSVHDGLHLRATLGMVGGEAVQDVSSVRRARARFAELGEESAVNACDALLVRLGAPPDREDDPLRTVEMSQVDGVFAQAESTTGPRPTSEAEAVAVAQVDPLAPTAEGQVVASRGELRARSSEPTTARVPPSGLGPNTPRPLPRERLVDTGALLGLPPAAAPPLVRPIDTGQLPKQLAERPVRGARPGPKPPLVVWPPPRDPVRFGLSLAVTLALLLIALMWTVHTTRKAVAAHRAAAAHTEPTDAPRLTPETLSKRARAAVEAPPDAPPSEPRATLPSLEPPLEVPAPDPTAAELPGTPSLAPRARARQLNIEGFRAYEANDLAAARAGYEGATRADPTFALPWYNLACIEALGRDTPASIAALRAYLERSPGTDLRERIRSDRDFAAVRDTPAFRTALDALLGDRSATAPP
jgi:hypothetical protein